MAPVAGKFGVIVQMTHWGLEFDLDRSSGSFDKKPWQSDVITQGRMVSIGRISLPDYAVDASLANRLLALCLLRPCFLVMSGGQFSLSWKYITTPPSSLFMLTCWTIERKIMSGWVFIPVTPLHI